MRSLSLSPNATKGSGLSDFDPDYGQVGFRVTAYEFRLQHSAILHVHLYGFSAFNNMVVGDDQALCVNDET